MNVCIQLYRKSLTTRHLGHLAHGKGTPGHKPSTTDALWLTLPYPSPAERYYNLPLESSETGGASAPARLSPAELAVTSRMGFRRTIPGLWQTDSSLPQARKEDPLAALVRIPTCSDGAVVTSGGLLRQASQRIVGVAAIAMWIHHVLGET